MINQYGKSYEELVFTDDFMFSRILSANLDITKDLISMILGIQIREIVLAEAQKSVDITSDGKSVRFDIYVEDPENRIYDLEMQSAGISGLPKRSRYYQGMIDLNTISKGEWYNKLRKSYVIFICLKDPFGAGQCMYTFEKFRQVFTRRKRVRRSGSKNS